MFIDEPVVCKIIPENDNFTHVDQLRSHGEPGQQLYPSSFFVRTKNFPYMSKT